MYNLFGKRILVGEVRRINAATFVRDFLQELKKKKWLGFTKGTITDGRDAKRFAHLINSRKSDTIFLSPIDCLQVGFVRSNIKGFVWYFFCPGCERRTRYLHQPTDDSDILCRLCYGLTYRQPGQRERRMSKMMRSPYLTPEEQAHLMEIARKDKTIDLPWMQKKMYN